MTKELVDTRKACKRHRWRALFAPVTEDVDGRICDRCDAVQTIYSMTPRQVAQLRKLAMPPGMVRAFRRLYPLPGDGKCEEQ